MKKRKRILSISKFMKNEYERSENLVAHLEKENKRQIKYLSKEENRIKSKERINNWVLRNKNLKNTYTKIYFDLLKYKTKNIKIEKKDLYEYTIFNGEREIPKRYVIKAGNNR